MTAKVFVALSTSVDGYITGPEPTPEQGLGRGGQRLFDWYFSGDTPSREFEGFRLSAASAEVFDGLAGRVGAVIAGRKTYDDSGGFGGGGPHPTAPLFVLTHTLPEPSWPAHTYVTTGIEDAVAQARQAAGTKDVALQGSQVVREALRAGLLDEIVVHQVPVLLGGGTPLFQTLPASVQLKRIAVVEADDVTHLMFRVATHQ